MPFCVPTIGEDNKDAPQAAGIVLIAADGEVLLLRRSASEPNYGGHWGLPGGKAEPGEDALSAALRECAEEMGHTIEDEGLRILDRVSTPNGMIFTTFCKRTPDKIVPKLDGEHSGYAWASLDMLPQPLHPSVKRTLGAHIGITKDMEPAEWDAFRGDFLKWLDGEEQQPAQDEGVEQEPNDDRLTWKPGDLEVFDPDGEPVEMPEEEIEDEGNEDGPVVHLYEVP